MKHTLFQDDSGKINISKPIATSDLVVAGESLTAHLSFSADTTVLKQDVQCEKTLQIKDKELSSQGDHVKLSCKFNPTGILLDNSELADVAVFGGFKNNKY